MKKLLICLIAVLLLSAVVIAVKPTGERQGQGVGEPSNTGAFGQCGNDKQCDDGNPGTNDYCDKSTSPGHCVNKEETTPGDDAPGDIRRRPP